MGVSIASQPQAPLASLADATAIALAFNYWFAQRVLAVYDTDTWDELEIKEHGNMLWDPTTAQWILTYSGESSDGLDHVGAVVSADGNVWVPHSQNPLSGATNAEDPYIAKTADGEVFRDSEDRALMFAEEKPTATGHRGINLFKSNVGSLDGWNLFGRVLDSGTAGQWDDQDVTSPVVVYDGAQLVMLYEGRDGSLGGEAASIGVATSADEGETWTRGASNPIIDRADHSWAAAYIVPDDVLAVGSSWYLLCHGSPAVASDSFHIGRLETADVPGSWDDTSFAAMTGNPFDGQTNTLMAWKNDPRFAVAIDRPQQRLLACAVTPA